MSDTRNHTTRDQLADALYGLTWTSEYADAEDEIQESYRDRADELLASDAIAAVRAAAVAETTAAIEAVLDKFPAPAEKRADEYQPGDFVTLGQSIGGQKVRAALSGGRTALDTAKAAAWDEALEAVANERGSFGMQTRNPYRADTGADQ